VYMYVRDNIPGPRERETGILIYPDSLSNIQVGLPKLQLAGKSGTEILAPFTRLDAARAEQTETTRKFGSRGQQILFYQKRAISLMLPNPPFLPLPSL
jgi:hypothetical protein